MSVAHRISTISGAPELIETAATQGAQGWVRANHLLDALETGLFSLTAPPCIISGAGYVRILGESAEKSDLALEAPEVSSYFDVHRNNIRRVPP